MSEQQTGQESTGMGTRKKFMLAAIFLLSIFCAVMLTLLLVPEPASQGETGTSSAQGQPQTEQSANRAEDPTKTEKSGEEQAEPGAKTAAQTTTQAESRQETTAEASTREVTTEDAKTASSEKGTGVTVEYQNGWESGGKKVGQLDVRITNSGEQPLTGWSVVMDVDEGMAIEQGWGGTYEIQDGVLTVTPADYNPEVPAKGTLKDIGFIMDADSEESLKQAAASARLLINGKAPE